MRVLLVVLVALAACVPPSAERKPTLVEHTSSNADSSMSEVDIPGRGTIIVTRTRFMFPPTAAPA
jgi:hypothetical protein